MNARTRSGDEPRLKPRGSNHVGMREYNERVVLQAIRLHGSLPKADIARLTRLTPQTVQLIIGRLEADALVVKQAPLRGKVGQPSVPMALNPDGAFSIGIKIGRRSLDLLLVDFTGQARQRLTLTYAFPDPDTLFDAIREQLDRLHEALGAERTALLHGIGVVAPLDIGGWQRLLGVDPALADRWRGIDIRERVGAMTTLPVEFAKDTAAACVAELVAGRGRSLRSFLYVFVDTFIGGGLVLDSHLRGGVHGNAGAVGSMAFGLPAPPGGTPPAQLLSMASVIGLEARYADAGLDTQAATDDRALDAPWRAATDAWLADAAPAVALAVHSAACLLDLDGVIVDGTCSRGLLGLLLARTEAAFAGLDWEGVVPPQLLAGTIGSDARAIGGALLPLYANFAPDRDLFLKRAI